MVAEGEVREHQAVRPRGQRRYVGCGDRDPEASQCTAAEIAPATEEETRPRRIAGIRRSGLPQAGPGKRNVACHGPPDAPSTILASTAAASDGDSGALPGAPESADLPGPCLRGALLTEPEEDHATMFEAAIRAKRFERGQMIEGRREPLRRARPEGSHARCGRRGGGSRAGRIRSRARG